MFRRFRAADAGSETALVVGVVSGSHFVNHMYLVLLPPILGILTTEFGLGLTALGVAMGVQGAVNTVFQLPYGYLSDNRSRTLVMGLSLGLGAAGAFIVALAPSYAWLIVGQAVLGLGVAGHHAAHFPLLSAATPAERRGRAFSVHGFAGNLGFAAPPAIITAIVSLSDLTWRHAIGLIAAVGAVYGVLAVAVLARRVSDEVTRPTGASPGAEGRDETSLRRRVRREVGAFRASPAILALAALATVTSTASWGVTSYAVVMLTDGYGIALETANLALTGMFVAAAVTILVGGELTDRTAAGPVLVATYSAVAVLVAAFGSMLVPAAAALAVVVLIGGTRSLATPARSKLTDRLSSRGNLGRNFAAVTVGIMVGNGLAPPLFGALIETAGLRVAFATVAGLAVVAVALTLGIIRGFGSEVMGGPHDAPGD